MVATENREPGLLRVLREPHPHLFVRSIVSLMTACLLAAGGILGGVILEGTRIAGFGWARHQYEEIGITTASVAWLIALRLIWAPVRGRRQIVRPVFSTLAIWICALLLTALLRGNLGVVVVLLAIAFTLHCWAAAFVRWSRGRAVLGSDNLVDVRCPQCRYSLVGMTECRCPECGFAFTIDGLIAAQGYGGIFACGEAPRKARAAERPETGEARLSPT